MTDPMPQPKMLSTAAVAELLGVDVRTVRRLIERGELPAHRIGSTLRVHAADLRTYYRSTRIDASGTTHRYPDGDEVIHLSAPAPAAEAIHLRQPAALAPGEFQLDAANGVLRNVSVMTAGPARGHGFHIDRIMLRQVAEQINAHPRGVRSRLAHPGPGGDQEDVGTLIGRVRDARLSGDRLRGDLHLGDYAAHSPAGDLRRYVLGIAEADPELVGLSVAFVPDEFDADPSGIPLGRSRDVFAADVVGDPAANRSGLLSSPPPSHDETETTPLWRKIMPFGKKPTQTGTPSPAESAVPQGGYAEPTASEPNATLSARERERIALAERKRFARLNNLASATGLTEGWAHDHFQRGTSIETAKELAIEHLHVHDAPIPGLSGHVRVGEDQRVNLAAAMSDGLALRLGARIERPADGAERFRHGTLLQLGVEHLKMLGVDTAGRTNASIARLLFNPRALSQAGVGSIALSHSTGDFPALLADGIGKRLRSGYAEAPSTWPIWAGRTTAPDFKEIKRPTLSLLPTPPRVLEGAEYTYATVGETGETYQLSKYGQMFALTWETLVNDDLQAFARLVRGFGAICRRVEDDAVYTQLTGNPTMAETGNPLFDANHSNVAGTPADITLESLSQARSSLALQTAPPPRPGEEGVPLNLPARFLLVPVELEDKARQLVSSTIDPTKSNATPNYQSVRELTIIADGRLSRDSTTAWYLAADPTQVDTIEVAFLAGEEAPFIDEEDAFSVDERRFKMRHVCAARVLDFRGLYKNAGQ